MKSETLGKGCMDSTLGAHYAKKLVFGPVLEVGADLRQFLEILCTKFGGTPAAAAQTALAPAPAAHNRRQKILNS